MPIDERKQRDSDLGEVATTVGGLLAIILRRGRFVAGQWTLPNGRVVTPKQVERLLLQIERVGGRRAVRVTQEVLAGRIPLRVWTIRMTQIVKETHTLAAQLAAGRSAVAEIGEELKYLARFAKAIDKKRAGSPAKVKSRAKSYLMAIGVTYAVTKLRVMSALQYTEARRIRTARESCRECISFAGRWMPIEMMPPKGSLLCGSRCRCQFEYR